MSEELRQKRLMEHGLIIRNYEFYNIGATTLNQLKKAKIIPNKDYKKYGSRKPDGLIVDRRNKSRIKVCCVIEHKDDGKFTTDADKKNAIEEGNDLCQILNAEVGIATDNSSYIWFNPNEKNTNTEYFDRTTKTKRSYTIIEDSIGDKFDKPFEIDQKTDEIEITKLNLKTRQSIESLDLVKNVLSKNNSKLTKDEIKDPSPLAKQIWQDVWSVTGKDPEKCLYTFVELFIFKYLSDLGILTKDEKGNKINFHDIIKLEKEEAFVNYHSQVREYLKTLFEPAKDDGTTIINGTILNPTVTEHSLVFYRILKRFEEFGQLKNIDPSFKSKVFEEFMKESISTKNWGRYFTPRNVIDAMIEISDIEKLEEGSTICDPACGVGGFILEPMKVKKDVSFYYKVEGDKIKPRYNFIGFDKGFEKEEQLTIILAKANMLIFLSELLKDNQVIIDDFAKLFNSTFKLTINSVMGTLEKTEPDKYDLILTNPPYVTSGSSNYKDKIKNDERLRSFYKKKGMGVEGLFVEWIVRSLKPSKKAFVVIPDGILHRLYDDKLREFIKEECIIDGIISLPVKTFYTTQKKTYILAITKKPEKTEEERKKHVQTEPVFTYLVSSIGETLDTYRFSKGVSNDLPEMVCMFNQFKGSKEGFVSNSKRCIIQPFEKFETSSHWSVDRWWEMEDKIELGVEDEENEITKEEFIELLKEKKDEIIELVNDIEEKLGGEQCRINLDSEYTFVEKTIQDVFSVNRGSSYYTKKRIGDNNWEGNVPVYSSKTTNDGILMKIKKEFIEKEEDMHFEHCLTWTTDGYAGTIFVRNSDNTENKKDEKYFFVITDHCGILKPLVTNLHLPFFKRMLQPIFYDFAKGYGKKELKLNQVKNIMIKIPIDANGDYDLDKQKQIAQLYDVVEKMKRDFLQNIDLIVKQKILLFN